jgi:hypothetical protein
MSTNPEQFDQLPDELVERLRARERRVASLTPAVDRAIDAAVREHFAPRRQRPAARRRWQVPAAAAAAVALLALFVLRPFPTEPTDAPPPGVRLADDVDGSGRIDILDAFVLARARAEDPAAVSQDRIDRITRGIVALAPPENVL